MAKPDILASLLAHTGGLRPTETTARPELDDLRRAMAECLRQGQPESEIGPPPGAAPSEAEVVADLRYVVSNPGVEQHAMVRMIRRETPAALPLPSDEASQWSAGLRPARSFGPFVDRTGRCYWFDLFEFASQVRLRRGAQGQDFLVLPQGVYRGPISQALIIPAGTVWIAANQFTNSAPPNSFVGLRVKGGTLAFDRRSRLLNSLLLLMRGSTVTLTLTLDPPTISGPATGPGAEAAGAQAALPETATFVFLPAGIQTIRVSDASVSVYGNTVALIRNDRPAFYEPDLGRVLVPLTANPDRVAIANPISNLFRPSGSTRLTGAAWGLTVTTGQPNLLGTAAGCGSLVLIVSPGLEGQWSGLAGRAVALNKTYISVDSATLMLIAPAAANLRASHTFELWRESALPGRCTVEAVLSKPFPLWFFSLRRGLDAIQAHGTAIAHIDRPLQAGGTRIEPRFAAILWIIENASGITLLVASRETSSESSRQMALALSNALLTTTHPLRLFVNGKLASPTQVDQGTLNLYFGLYQVLPSLPDPYAANFEPVVRDAPFPGVQVHANITWQDPSSAKLDINLDPLPDANALGSVLPSPRLLRQGDDLWELFSGWLRAVPRHGLALLDISSNADQFGVALGFLTEPANETPLTVQDLALTTTGSNVRVFLLPQFQWEPVYNRRNPLVPTDPDGMLLSANDGGPSLAGMNSVRLVPVTPVSVVAEVVRSYHEDQRAAGVLFTLPFGIQAFAALNVIDRRYRTPPDLQLIAPDFGALTGARQLSLQAGTASLIPFEPGPVQSLLSGRAKQTLNFVNPPPTNTLGVLGTPFDQAFQARVPITRIDLSGYGANTFSRWFDEANPDVGITQVCFDAFHGRTSFERIQMTSILWPCLARVVRTITIERYGNGSPVRWDSGWIATTPGLFVHSKANTFHKGVVQGFFDIREIRDTDLIFDLDNGNARVQAVYYDTDVAINGVVRGASGAGRVPARRQLGFVQHIPIGSQAGAFLSPIQAKELFDSHGPIGGPIDCGIRIGQSQQEMSVTGVFASNGGLNPDSGILEFAVAVYGSPVLPAAGQWSVVRVQNNANSVQPVDSQLGVPLVRKGAGAYRWAEPSQLFAPNPDFDYGLLFSTETHRVLFPRPKVEPVASEISSLVKPLLADPYALLSSGELFPRLEDAIAFDTAAYGLAPVGGLLQLSPNPFPIPVPARFRSLVDVSSWRDRLDYRDAAGQLTRFLIDSNKNWTIDANGVSQVLEFPLVGEILRVVHKIHAPADGPPDFPDPGVKFSSLLEPVAEVLHVMQQWMPELPGPLKVSASFSGSTFRLSAIADFQIATRNGDAIECGVGKLKGNLKVGGELSAELLKQNITGAVFVEVTGSYQQLVFPEIYGGGLLRFAIRADQSGKTTVDLDACTVGSVGGDIIPHVVSLEATVKYGYWIQFVDGAFRPGFILGMEGRAKLLDGLLGFKLGVEGRVLIGRKKTPATDLDNICQLHGEILISGTVTVAWLIEERKSFRAQFDVNVGWRLVVGLAKAGLLPVP